MATYTLLTLTNRATAPDPGALQTALRVIDATAGFAELGPDIRVKTTGALSGGQIAAMQAALDTCPALTARSQAQSTIDAWPIEYRALLLALLDQLNTIRAALPTPLAPITPAQALAAVRAKAGTL